MGTWVFDGVKGEKQALRNLARKQAAEITALREALAIAAPEYCSMRCPSVYPTGTSQPHTAECEKIRAALTAPAKETDNG